MNEQFPQQQLNLAEIKSWFRKLGCTALFVKELAWNHDSKRQIYLSTDLTPFNQFPNRMEVSPALHPSIQATMKPKAKGSDRIFGHLDFYWLSTDLSLNNASEAKLIFYPQYPETRLSGFLRGSKTVPSKYLRAKSGEEFENRLLFLGTDRQSKTIGFLVVGHDELRDQIRDEDSYDQSAGLNRLELSGESTSEERLLSALRKIHFDGWHDGVRLKDGNRVPCVAPQAVGSTLEALLGVAPNSNNAPDFEGYEVKALTVQKPGWKINKAVTLMTPEPDIGIYCRSIYDFLSAYGYDDQKGRSDRKNFGGVYRVGLRVQLTGLLLKLVGYSLSNPDKMDSEGVLAMVDDDLQTAAAWSFVKLLNIWKRKHEKAVYVQVNKRTVPTVQFNYLSEVQICEGADFIKVLKCIAEGKMYLDPAVKAEGWNSGNPKIKKRNQFRVPVRSIPDLYLTSKIVDLSAGTKSSP